MAFGCSFYCMRVTLYSTILLALLLHVLVNSGIFHRGEERTVYNITHFAFSPNRAKFDVAEIQAATRTSQFIRFWTENPDVHVPPAAHSSNYVTREQVIATLGHDPMDDIKDYFHAVFYEEYDRSIIIQVDEFYKGNLTSGGSSIRGSIFGGGILITCSFEDYFNGTYLLTCPVLAQCVQVNITVLHLTFHQYHHGVTKRLDLDIFNEEKCVSFSEFHERPSAYWIQKSPEQWTWFDKGVSYPYANESEFCRLVDRMTGDRFYMIGSSHMRYQHQYLVVTCLRHIHDLHRRLFYVRARFNSNLRGALLDFTTGRYWSHCAIPRPHENTKNRNTTLEDIEHYLEHHEFKTGVGVCRYDTSMKTGLLIQTGSWDLVYNGLKHCLQHGMPQVEVALYKLDQFQRTQAPSLRIAVMGPPTFHPHDVYAENRNNDHIQVFNHALGTVAARRGLRYVDVFNMMYPRFERVTENNHYLACDSEGCHHDVGIVAIQLAVTELARQGDWSATSRLLTRSDGSTYVTELLK